MSVGLGSARARERRSRAPYVPSAVLRAEANAVLDPAHAEFASVELTVARDFRYDPPCTCRAAPARPAPVGDGEDDGATARIGREAREETRWRERSSR
jgi:hypothetical protein